MRSFREFLIERYGLGQNYNLPNMDDIRDPNVPPIGGFNSFGQRADYGIERSRKTGPLQQVYAQKDSLERLKNLAEQAASAIKNRQSGSVVSGRSMQSDYSSATFPNNNEWLIRLSKKEIIGGSYPQIRQDDLNFATNQGIFTRVNNGGEEYFDFNIKTLGQKMEEIRQLLMVHERDHERTRYRAGIADDAWNKGKDFVKGIVYGQSNLKIPGVTGL